MKSRAEVAIGAGYVVGGVLLASNAIVSGPRAFSGGRAAVTWLVVAGLLLGIGGARVLWGARRGT